MLLRQIVSPQCCSHSITLNMLYQIKFFNALQLKLHIELNQFSTYFIALQTYILLDRCYHSNDIQLEMELFEI